MEAAWMLMNMVKELTEQPSSSTTGVTKLPQALVMTPIPAKAISIQQPRMTQA